ncbi:exo-beta-N-acetylmuramidase NamZ family protein [Pseudoalteromonas sp. T1lg65]|uniref:exo-beta-N-acetylmuramidase NamZ family protein n=1 Tax=Pseudoalteromonas sp. T1lg65 TaxID=2077101 RepID=UPI003F7ADFFC
MLSIHHALVFFICLLFPCTLAALTVGAERSELYMPLLKDKKVGLIVNHSSTVGQEHLLDYLIKQKTEVKRVFAPEHGFRGNHDAGAKVADGKDPKTGTRITSLYGSNKKPKLEDLADLDILIFDIQDVGVRFYTYISTMHLAMEAASEAGIEFWVFDRPNPNINFIDGPVLEPKFRSFVGMHPIPVLHGMTVGELAQMIVGEGWLGTDNTVGLRVFPVKDYDVSKEYILPTAPSPNLPNQTSIYLYPSLCFFEATPVSVGRGTEWPFQVFGYIDPTLGSFEFTPRPIIGAASNPKLNGLRVFGTDLRRINIKGLNLSWLIETQQEFAKHKKELFSRASFMDKLAGTDLLRKWIESGLTEQQIRQRWQPALEQFKRQRRPYLIYAR